MRLTRFKYSEHAPLILKWLLLRGLTGNVIEDLPKIGYVAVEEEPVAAGFLRKLEPHFAILDGLITKPIEGCANKSQNKAVDLIVERLIEKAKEMGLKQLLANSVDRGVLKRSEKFGFKKVPHQMIALNLMEEA